MAVCSDLKKLLQRHIKQLKLVITLDFWSDFLSFFCINTTFPELISAHAHLGNPFDCSSAPKFGSVHCCKPTNHNHGIQTAWIIVSGLIINITNRPITKLLQEKYRFRVLDEWFKGTRWILRLIPFILSPYIYIVTVEWYWSRW